jgi:hypothetical protein
MNNFQNFSSDIVIKILEYLDIKELENTNQVCKNFHNDCEKFSKKHSENLKRLIKKYTCRFCEKKGYSINNFCTDCYLHMCDNCYTIRNDINEFTKTPFINNLGFFDYKRMCHDCCIFRCFNCKMFDDRHQLYLNDENEMKSICVNCFCNVDKNDKTKYTPAFENLNNDWDLNELD